MQKGPTKKLWRKIGLQKNFLQGTSHSDQYKNTLSQQQQPSHTHTQSQHSHRISQLQKNYLLKELINEQYDKKLSGQENFQNKNIHKQNNYNNYSTESPIDRLNFQSFDQRYNLWNKEMELQQKNLNNPKVQATRQNSINFHILPQKTILQNQKFHKKHLQQVSIQNSLHQSPILPSSQNQSQNLSVQTNLYQNQRQPTTTNKFTYPNINSPNNKLINIHINYLTQDGNKNFYTKSLPPRKVENKNNQQEKSKKTYNSYYNQQSNNTPVPVPVKYYRQSIPQKSISFQQNQTIFLQNTDHQNQNTLQIVQCEQILTIQPRQLQHYKSTEQSYHKLLQQTIPLAKQHLKYEIKQLKQFFSSNKSYINLQLTLFYNFINKDIKTLVQDQIQQYTDQIGYLYKQNQELMDKIQEKQTINKKLLQDVNSLQTKLSTISHHQQDSVTMTIEQKNALNKLIETQQNEINKLYEKLQDFQELQTKNQLSLKTIKTLQLTIQNLKQQTRLSQLTFEKTLKQTTQLHASKISKLTAQLASKSQTLNKTLEQTKSKTLQIQKLSQKIQMCNKQKQEKQQKIKELQSEINLVYIKVQEKQFKLKMEYENRQKQMEREYEESLRSKDEVIQKLMRSKKQNHFQPQEEQWQLIAKQYEKFIQQLMNKISALEVQNIITKFNLQKNQYMKRILVKKTKNSNNKLTINLNSNNNSHAALQSTENNQTQISPKSDSNTKNLRTTGFFGEIGGVNNLNIRLDDIQGKYSKEIQEEEFYQSNSNNPNSYARPNNRSKQRKNEKPRSIQKHKQANKQIYQNIQNQASQHEYQRDQPQTKNYLLPQNTYGGAYNSKTSTTKPYHHRIKTQSKEYFESDNNSEFEQHQFEQKRSNYDVYNNRGGNRLQNQQFKLNFNPYNQNIHQSYNINSNPSRMNNQHNYQTSSLYGANHNYSFSQINNQDKSSSWHLDDNQNNDRRKSMISQRAETYRQSSNSVRYDRDLNKTSREKRYLQNNTRGGYMNAHNNQQQYSNLSMTNNFNNNSKYIGQSNTRNNLPSHNLTTTQSNNKSDRNDIVQKIKERLKQKFNKNGGNQHSNEGPSYKGVSQKYDNNKKLFRQSEYNHRKPIINQVVGSNTHDDFGVKIGEYRSIGSNYGYHGNNINLSNESPITAKNTSNRQVYNQRNNSRSNSRTPNKSSRSPSNSSGIGHRPAIQNSHLGGVNHNLTSNKPSSTSHNASTILNRTVIPNTTNYTKINKPTGNLISTSFSKSGNDKPQYISQSRLSTTPLSSYQHKSSLYTANKVADSNISGTSSYLKKY